MPDLISFDIQGAGVHTISPASVLPTITDPVVIDGYTQPGASANTLASGSNAVLLIELSGGQVPTPFPAGLAITAGNSTVRGLIINRFTQGGDGIFLGTNGGNKIIGNWLGTDSTGNAAAGNFRGIEANNGSTNNIIGGTAPQDRNVLSGNSQGVTFFASSGNLVQGNYVGTNPAGKAAVGNDNVGVWSDTGSGGNQIGGTTAAARNVISGNNTGVSLGEKDTVQGNFIGTDVTGTLAIPNLIGILVDQTFAPDNNLIGGTATGAGNLISGNTNDGIDLGRGESNNTVQGNLIGTDVTGVKPLGNGRNGILISGAGGVNDLIGGTAPSAGNTIAFNGNGPSGGAGVFVDSLNTGHAILGNSIFQNVGLGIDLSDGGPPGFTPNDPGDADGFGNNQQNFPENISATVSGQTLNVQYTVTSTTANSAYPLRIELYKADIAGQEGQTFVGSDTYDTASAGTPKSATITLPAGFTLSAGDLIVATATDANNNTSEFSPHVTVAALTLHTPSVTNSVTYADTQSSTGLVITPNAADVNSTKFFQITNITNGTLFQNDGVTQINDGDFIAVADGAAGLKFTPAAGFVGSGSFDVQSSTTNTSTGLSGGIATATINVIQPTVTVAVTSTSGLAPPTALEGSADRLVYTFTRTDDPSLPLSVDFTVGGTAAFPGDYSIGAGSANTSIGGTTGTVDFAAGNSTATVILVPLSDNLVEGDETVQFTVTAQAQYTTTTPPSGASATIQDANAATVAFQDASSNAPEAGGAHAVTIVLSLAAGDRMQNPTTLSVSAINGTASNTDYDSASFPKQVTFSEGSQNGAAQTVAITPTADSVVEGDETVTLKLAVGSSPVTLGNQQTHIVTIQDANAATLSIANTADAAEPATNGSFTVTQSLVSTTDTVIHYTVSGTASSGLDYTALSLSVTIPAGQQTATIDVGVLDDNIVEGNETVVVTLNTITAGNAGISIDPVQNAATVNIADDDTATLSITANSPTTAEGAAGGTHQVTYTVKLDHAVAGGFTVAFSPSGTATLNTDYTVSPTSPLTFTGNANESHDITITILGDNTVEADETAIFTLETVTPGSSSVSAINIATGASATTTIINDDTATLTISANSPTTAEGAAGNTHQVTYTVTANNPVAGGFTVAFSPSGTATLNTDYTVNATSPLTFVGNANESHDITVTIQGDDTVESDESVKLTLGLVTPQTVGVSAANIVSGASATTIIQNDDFAGISVSPLNLAQTEGTGSGTKNFAFTVTLTNKADQNITVDFATADNTATAPSDYSSQSGTLTFAPGQQSKQIIVLVNQDSVVEGDESFFVNLTNAKFNGVADATRTSITESQATGVIQNDDTATLTIKSSSSPTLEGPLGASHQVTFTVGVNNAVAGGFSVAFSASGTATLGSDYTIVGSSPLIFTGAANETHDIVVTILGDNTVEPDETVTLALGTVTPAAIAGSITTGATATITIQNDDFAGGGLVFGTAPKSYGTLLADDGARHQLGSGLFLGAKVDPSTDGNPAAANTGDPDDDGVKLPGYIVPGLDASVTIIASKAGKLDAWVDFNRNGKFDTTDRIFSSVAVAAGTNTLKFTVPLGIATSTTFARFRLSSAGGLGPTGLAADGEVEDYALKVMTPAADTAVLIDDPANPGSKVLVITSAKNNHNVQLTMSGGSILCRRGCKISTYLAANIGRIAAISSGGSDTITVPSSMKIPLQLIGKWKTIKGK